MGTGGLRYGAGRPGWHLKAEHCRYLDSRRWARENILCEGRVGGWAWRDSDTGKTTASIGYRVASTSVSLVYSLNGESMDQRVPIHRTKCHFGGSRLWFGCPRCDRRIAVLYLRNRGFACRKCNRIAYSSQSEDAMGRAWRKEAKIERRLTENWQRPKGMHLATYERLIGQLTECEEVRETALCDRLGAMLQRHPWLSNDPLFSM